MKEKVDLTIYIVLYNNLHIHWHIITLWLYTYLHSWNHFLHC